MLVYPSGVDVSSSALRFLSACPREHRRALGTRWRRLTAGRQALLALAHLRNGHTYAQLAAGFSIGTTTVYRYVTAAVDLLADLAPTLSQAARTASMKAFVILDGTLLPIDRIAADRPFCSEKHKRHGMNVQVVTDPMGRLLWASPALPGALHDIRAARERGIVDALAETGIGCSDKGYQGAGGMFRLPYRGRWNSLSAGPHAFSRSHADPRTRRAGHRDPQILAVPPQAPLLHTPEHQPRQSRPRPPSGQLRLRMTNIHCPGVTGLTRIFHGRLRSDHGGRRG